MVSNTNDIPKLLSKIKEKYASFTQNQDDGVKIFLDSGWIHVRPSNTEPIIRIFIEQATQDKAKRILEDVLSLA